MASVQKTRIRQTELLLLLELLQHLPYPLGDFRIQQRGKCAVCSKIAAQHSLQLFFGQAALQQRGSGAAAGQLFALEPYAHTGSAVQRHRIRGYPLPDFVQIGGRVLSETSSSRASDAGFPSAHAPAAAYRAAFAAADGCGSSA